jgi:hypothetical protein
MAFMIRALKRDTIEVYKEQLLILGYCQKRSSKNSVTNLKKLL